MKLIYPWDPEFEGPRWPFEVISSIAGDYNWTEVFAAAGHPAPNTAAGHPYKVQGAQCSEDPYTIDDIAVVLALSDSAAEESDWLASVLLWDGRFSFVLGNCAYTGWDAGGGGIAWVADNYTELVRWAYNDDARARLVYTPTDELEVVADALKQGLRSPAVLEMIRSLNYRARYDEPVVSTQLVFDEYDSDGDIDFDLGFDPTGQGHR